MCTGIAIYSAAGIASVATVPPPDFWYQGRRTWIRTNGESGNEVQLFFMVLFY